MTAIVIRGDTWQRREASAKTGRVVHGKARVPGTFSAAIFNLLLKKNMDRFINLSKNPLSL
jgi:hypothetical protein